MLVIVLVFLVGNNCQEGEMAIWSVELYVLLPLYQSGIISLGSDGQACSTAFAAGEPWREKREGPWQLSGEHKFSASASLPNTVVECGW